MKTIGNSRILRRIAAGLAVLLLLGGCGAKTENWAYDYDRANTILSLGGNGKAVYGGVDYSYTREGEFLRLKDKSGNVTNVRFVPNGDGMLLYVPSVYSYSGENSAKGLTGLWTQDNGWSFEFTEEGTFCEEGIFYGHYLADEAAGTIRLMYDDPIEDAILYYSVNGNELTVEYPWPVVHTAEG